MSNSKRKQEVVKIDLNVRSPEEIAEIAKQVKAILEKCERERKFCYMPAKVELSDVETAILKPEEVENGALWYFWRMLTWYHKDLWWGWAAWEAFGWWEGENPFKSWRADSDKDFGRGDITYLKNLDFKGEEKTYSEPQGERAFFIVKDLQRALDALEKAAALFALSYEDGLVKLKAWNEERPDFGACLMVKYDWRNWCATYYKDYNDLGQKLLEYSYGISTPDPVWKDGKLVFGDKFEKTPKEFVYDMATLEPPVD